MALIGPPSELAYRVDRFAPGIYRAFFDRLQRAHSGLRVRPTSFWRSRADNARVGGAANSQHLLATAIDLTYPDSRTRATAIANLRALGLIAIDEGDHVHVQAWPGEVAVKLVRAVGA